MKTFFAAIGLLLCMFIYDVVVIVCVLVVSRLLLLALGVRL